MSKRGPETVPKSGPEAVPKSGPETVPKIGPETVPRNCAKEWTIGCAKEWTIGCTKEWNGNFAKRLFKRLFQRGKGAEALPKREPELCQRRNTHGLKLVPGVCHCKPLWNGAYEYIKVKSH